MLEQRNEASGLPDTCPRCERLGYLTHIDLRGGIKHQVCRDCGMSWTTRVARSSQANEAGDTSTGKLTLTALLERAAERRNAGSLL
jgi:hypothetical protein